MKNIKEVLIILIGLLITFAIGYYFGTQGNDRYFLVRETGENTLALFDKRTGKIFVRKTSQEKTKYSVIDIVNAERNEYKPKQK